MTIKDQLTYSESTAIRNMLKYIASEDALRVALEKMGYTGEDLTRNLEATNKAFSRLRGIL